MGIAVVLTCSIIIASLLNGAFGCSCMHAHPQSHACNADFVIVARVKSETVKDEQIFYRVKITKRLKMSDKATVALKSERLVTADDEAKCGVRLIPKEVYLITGKIINLQARINLCNYIKPWSQVTRRQRKGFKKLFYQGCNCQINKCFWYQKCTHNKEECNWDMGRHRGGEDCQQKHGICLRNSSGSCTWTRNMAQKSCEKARLNQRQRQLELEP